MVNGRVTIDFHAKLLRGGVFTRRLANAAFVG